MRTRKESIKDLIINKFKLIDLGIDFMGYRFKKKCQLSGHHVIPRREGGKDKEDNLVVLVQDTSHNYLHHIERFDRKRFKAITEQLRKENKLGYIDLKILEEIDGILLEFEEQHREDTFKNGEILVRDIYRKRLIREKDKNLLYY